MHQASFTWKVKQKNKTNFIQKQAPLYQLQMTSTRTTSTTTTTTATTPPPATVTIVFINIVPSIIV